MDVQEKLLRVSVVNDFYENRGDLRACAVGGLLLFQEIKEHIADVKALFSCVRSEERVSKD